MTVCIDGNFFPDHHSPQGGMVGAPQKQKVVQTRGSQLLGCPSNPWHNQPRTPFCFACQVWMYAYHRYGRVRALNSCLRGGGFSHQFGRICIRVVDLQVPPLQRVPPPELSFILCIPPNHSSFSVAFLSVYAIATQTPFKRNARNMLVFVCISPNLCRILTAVFIWDAPLAHTYIYIERDTYIYIY